MSKQPSFSLSLRSLPLMLVLGLPLAACSDDKDSSGGDDSSETPDDEVGGGVGNPVGDPIDIDHSTAAQTVEDNIILHMDGLQSAVEFLEDSQAVNNLIDLLFGDDDDDEGEESEEGEEDSEDDSIDLDMTEARDELVEMMADRMMVESTATVAEDGLSVLYAIDPAIFCAEDAEEDESEEDAAERLEEETDCVDTLTENPMSIDVMSDNEGDVNLTLKVGEAADDVLTIQMHDDQISAVVNLPKIKQFVEVFVSPEDFELPDTMEGSLGVEIRRDAADIYTLRFAVLEDVDVTPSSDQEPFSLHMSQAAEPGSITFDGSAENIAGGLAIDAMDASLPWQIIVDMFYDDEGYSEWICETDDETGEEDCWEEWIEPEEAPEVDQAFIADVPGVTAVIDYNSADDAFAMTNLGLGDETMTVRVDGDTIVSVDVNPDNGRRLDFTFNAPGEKDLGFAFSENFGAQVQFAWHKVSEAFEDLPDVLSNDTIGIQFAESDSPQIQILDIEDDTQIQMASGQLTLWAANMDDDVVIGEGECFVGTECDEDEDCEDEDEHDLFGGIEGGTCDE